MAVSETKDLEKATGALDEGISESRIVKPQAVISSLPDDDFSLDPEPPLRSLTTLRGRRPMVHTRRGFREYMHDQKVKAKIWLKEGPRVRKRPLDGEGDAISDKEISHIEFLHRYSILSSRVKVLRHFNGEDGKLRDPSVVSEVLRDLSEYSTLTPRLGSR